MSFQAYIDNIYAKTGKTPADFKTLAAKKGLLEPGIKAGAIVEWLKADFDLGHGHAMAIYATLKGKGPVADKKTTVSAGTKKSTAGGAAKKVAAKKTKTK